jgi:hypothetical protein
MTNQWTAADERAAELFRGDAPTIQEVEHAAWRLETYAKREHLFAPMTLDAMRDASRLLRSQQRNLDAVATFAALLKRRLEECWDAGSQAERIPKTVEQIVAEQGVKPLEDFAALEMSEPLEENAMRSNMSAPWPTQTEWFKDLEKIAKEAERCVEAWHSTIAVARIVSKHDRDEDAP